MEALLVHLLVLIFVAITSAQSLDAISSTSPSSATDLSFSTGTASQPDGQLSAFITVTRSSETSAPAPTSSSPANPPTPPGSNGGSPGFSTGYTIGTAIGGAIGGLLIILLLIFWFRAHKKKKQRLSIVNGSASSNKLMEKEKEKAKEDKTKTFFDENATGNKP